METILFNPHNLAWMQLITFLNLQNWFGWTISMTTFIKCKEIFFCIVQANWLFINPIIYQSIFTYYYKFQNNSKLKWFIMAAFITFSGTYYIYIFFG